jgi:hypothetical protein
MIICSVGYVYVGAREDSTYLNGSDLDYITENALEIILGLWILYFFGIVKCRPYSLHEAGDVFGQWHNYALMFYYGVGIVFMAACVGIKRLGKGDWGGLFIGIVYLSALGLILVVLVGYVRLFLEYKYRKWLLENQHTKRDTLYAV